LTIKSRKCIKMHKLRTYFFNMERMYIEIVFFVVIMSISLID
jgi:hypothetical protein